MTDARLPDAAPTNWVDRFASEGLRPWLKLGRFDRPTGIWLLMLPGWQGIALAAAMQGQRPDWKLLGLFLLGAALMRAAGCAYNDIVDRDLDRQVARTAQRPVASGRVGVRAAWAYVVACALVSLLILLSLNLLSFGLGVASLALVAAYPFMKRITWWPQAWLGLTFNWGALLGFAAASGGSPAVMWFFKWFTEAQGGVLLMSAEAVHAGMLAWPAALLYASGIFWTLGYDTIYAVQDLEDDALAGVKSSARRLGASTPKAVLIFYVIAFALALSVAFTGGLGPLFWPPAALFGLHLSRQAQRLNVGDPQAALALFKSNAWAGVLLFVAVVAGSWRPEWGLSS